ncbi:MAG: hypothetical protein KYX62_04605 [Pseudomonadota bacterium]|nr:hypothetical protein [Pseudomonadota bacterium]
MRRYLLIIILIVAGTAGAVYDGVLRYENARVQNIADHLLERVYTRALREYYLLLTDVRMLLQQGGSAADLRALERSAPIGPYIEAAATAGQLAGEGDWLIALGLEELDSRVEYIRDSQPVSPAERQPGMLFDIGMQTGSAERMAVRLDVVAWLQQITADLGFGVLPLKISWQGHVLSEAGTASLNRATVFPDFILPQFTLYLSDREIDSLFRQRLTAAMMAALVALPEFILLFWLWRQYFHRHRLQRALEQSHRDLEKQRYANELRTRLLRHRTEQVKGLNSDLEQARARMALSERLAALGEISAGIAHEINNPVAYSLSNLNSLKEDVHDLTEFIRRLDQNSGQLDTSSAFYRRLLQDYQELAIPEAMASVPERIAEMTDGIERVSHIVRDMRKLSREGTIERQMTDLNSDLTSIINIARSRLKGNIELIAELIPLPPVYCNGSQIGQVVLNILVNAIQAIGDRPGCIRLTQSLQADWLEIRICDDGPGMDEATASRVFEPFFTTKDAGQGTGMGLALCYQLIEEHQGHIELDTRPGSGTCFTLRLPLHPQPLTAGDQHNAE